MSLWTIPVMKLGFHTNRPHKVMWSFSQVTFPHHPTPISNATLTPLVSTHLKNHKRTLPVGDFTSTYTANVFHKPVAFSRLYLHMHCRWLWKILALAVRYLNDTCSFAAIYLSGCSLCLASPGPLSVDDGVYGRNDALSGDLLSSFHVLHILPFLFVASLLPLFPALACFSLSSHLSSLQYSPLSLYYSPWLLPPPPNPPSLALLPPTPSPPPFILGSPTVVMRCFIICISQLLIEGEFRLSPGSSVRELPWET